MHPGTRVLIVEDHPDIARNMADYFHRRLAEVKLVASGEAAVEAARDFAPDMLILDYRLPGIDGLETYARLQGLRIRYGCVMITAEASERVPMAARASGIREVLEKPFSFSELERAFGMTGR